MKETQVHVPVLVQEIVEALRPKPSGVYLDGTVGAGGHAQAILEAAQPDGTVVGLDLDPEALLRAGERLGRYGNRFRAVHGGYQEAASILPSLGLASVDGVVVDLGLSSDQVQDPERGFSFQGRGPLDMRFDTTSGLTLTEYLDRLSVNRLEEILATYGEERYCKKLARGILRARDRGALKTTEDLAKLVATLVGGRRGKIHPATRTFQALRIALNRELDNLAIALQELPGLLSPGGRLCVISYHSLEDRLVKHSFRDRSKDPAGWLVLTPRPIRPSPEEIRHNPRARSARMRVLEAPGGNIEGGSRRLYQNLESGDNRGTNYPLTLSLSLRARGLFSAPGWLPLPLGEGTILRTWLAPSPSGRGDYSPHLVGSLSLWERVGVRVLFHPSARNRATELGEPRLLRQFPRSALGRSQTCP